MLRLNKAGLSPCLFYLKVEETSLKTLLAKVAGLSVLIAASAVFAQLSTLDLTVGIYVIRAEVASTNDSRAQGLMFRKHLGPNEGMLFVFPRAEAHCMWMKNTLIPLSVAFVEESGRIVSISEMKPQTETTHCAARPAKFALEMSKGWFAAKGISPGSAIRGLEKAPPPR